MLQRCLAGRPALPRRLDQCAVCPKIGAAPASSAPSKILETFALKGNYCGKGPLYLALNVILPKAENDFVESLSCLKKKKVLVKAEQLQKWNMCTLIGHDETNLQSLVIISHTHLPPSATFQESRSQTSLGLIRNSQEPPFSRRQHVATPRKRHLENCVSQY